MAHNLNDGIDCALDLMRRLPPRRVVENLQALTQFTPELAEDMLTAVDQPLRSIKCSVTGRDFLICDYNRDANSYRSPFSNQYEPALENGAYPSEPLRKLEQMANAAFSTYRDLYYEGGNSSVYMWDLDGGFASVVLIQKRTDSGVSNGGWDSIHVFEVIENNQKKVAQYQLTSTIMLYLESEVESANLTLCGSITRQQQTEYPYDGLLMSHLPRLGTLVENMEGGLRNMLTSVYFERSREFVQRMRIDTTSDEPGSKHGGDHMQSELMTRIAFAGRKII